MAWVKGKSGNPNGRPKGHKDRFSAKFWADVHHDWNLHGAETIAQVREHHPTAYFRTMASILPQEEQARQLSHAIEVTLKEPDWLMLPERPSVANTTQAIDIIANNNDDVQD